MSEEGSVLGLICCVGGIILFIIYIISRFLNGTLGYFIIAVIISILLSIAYSFLD